jgi:hypothetical protein
LSDTDHSSNEPAPDYTTYSLEELKDAGNWLDAEHFPERAEAIEREIARRAEQAEATDLSGNEAAKSNPVRLLRGVAILEIVGGVIGIAASLWYIYLVTVQSPHWLLYLFITVFLGLYSLSIVGGILLWRLHRLGFLLSRLTQALQVIGFTHPIFSYSYVVGGAILVSFRWFHFSINFKAGSYFTAYYNIENAQGSVTVNVFAMLLFIGLLQAPRLLKSHTRKRILEEFE